MKPKKRMVLTGAAVMVMVVSFAVPAMANDYDVVGPRATEASEYSQADPRNNIWDNFATRGSVYWMPDSPKPYPDPYPCFAPPPC
jgi:hypothetical protein